MIELKRAQPFMFAFFAFTYLFALTGCSTLIRALYGMNHAREVDEKTIMQYAIKYNIPAIDSYELDTSYSTYLATFDFTHYREQLQNHSQPLQALYYDTNGRLQSFQVNCYASGFPNLTWKRNDIMGAFPPKQQAPLDSIIQLETHLKFLRP